MPRWQPLSPSPRNEGTVWQGRRLSTGQLIVKSPDADYHNLTSRGTVLRALLVPVDTIQSASRILTGSDTNQTFPLWRAPRIASEKMERFQRSLSELMTISLETPEVLAGPPGRAIEMECLRRLIDALETSSTATKVRAGYQDRGTIGKSGGRIHARAFGTAVDRIRFVCRVGDERSDVATSISRGSRYRPDGVLTRGTIARDAIIVQSSEARGRVGR